MRDPEFSIVTITRNDVPGLIETLRSVALQTYLNYEQIVVDGSDEKFNWNVEFNEPARSRIQYHFGADLGISDALNRGSQLCRGKRVIYLNSGDCFAAEDVLANIANAINVAESANQGNISDIYYGDAIIYDFNGNSQLQRCLTESQKLIFDVCHQSCVIPTGLAKAYAYDRRFKVCMDFDLWCEFAIDTQVRWKPLGIIVARYLNGGLSARFENRWRGIAERRLSRGLAQNKICNPFWWLGGTYVMGIEAVKATIHKFLGDNGYRRFKGIIKMGTSRE